MSGHGDVKQPRASRCLVRCKSMLKPAGPAQPGLLRAWRSEGHFVFSVRCSVKGEALKLHAVGHFCLRKSLPGIPKVWVPGGKGRVPSCQFHSPNGTAGKEAGGAWNAHAAWGARIQHVSLLVLASEQDTVRVAITSVDKTPHVYH